MTTTKNTTLTTPKGADDLTAQWCSDALGRPITSVTAEPMGVGVGLVGQLFRLDLDGPDGSNRMIAKLAAPTEESRFVATILNMYGREVGFYDELSARTTIGHPACSYAAHDPDTQDTILLLEDVSPRGHAFDQVVGCSAAEAEPAIRTLARFHADFWDDPSLTDTPWLRKLCEDPYPGSVAFAYEGALPSLPELVPDLMTPAVTAFAESYAAKIPALFAKLCEPPLVLSHGDWRLDNLFFTPKNDVVAIDFQLIDRSVGPRDLAYLMTQSVNVDDPDGYERAFDVYLSELSDHGITPEHDWAWEMYRYGTLLGFVYPVIVAGGLTVNDPRHLELVRAILTRSLRALEVLDAFDLPL